MQNDKLQKLFRTHMCGHGQERPPRFKPEACSSTGKSPTSLAMEVFNICAQIPENMNPASNQHSWITEMAMIVGSPSTSKHFHQVQAPTTLPPCLCSDKCHPRSFNRNPYELNAVFFFLTCFPFCFFRLGVERGEGERGHHQVALRLRE
jgi:hypothetical protein